MPAFHLSILFLFIYLLKDILGFFIYINKHENFVANIISLSIGLIESFSRLLYIFVRFTKSVLKFIYKRIAWNVSIVMFDISPRVLSRMAFIIPSSISHNDFFMRDRRIMFLHYTNCECWYWVTYIIILLCVFLNKWLCSHNMRNLLSPQNRKCCICSSCNILWKIHVLLSICLTGKNYLFI